MKVFRIPADGSWPTGTTQYEKRNIAVASHNAIGCSSIYGGNLPTTPYCKKMPKKNMALGLE